MRRLAALCLLLATAFAAEARSVMVRQRGNMIENTRYCSTNERFCLVLREHDLLGDFESKPVEVVFRWDEPEDAERPAPPDTLVAALYDGRKLVSLLTVDRLYNRWLVADSGRYLVEARYQSWWEEQDVLANIHRADGTLVKALTVGDVLTPSDRKSIGMGVALHLTLDGDRLAVGLPKFVSGPPEYDEVHVDLATGELLEPKRDLHPPLRAWATPASGGKPWSDWTLWTCKDPSALRIASKQLFARAIEKPLPEFPEIGGRARISGIVVVEVVVSETGSVVCTRFKGLPFGFNEASIAALRRWRFEPYLVDGEPVRVTSEIEFHFRRPEHAEWKQIVESFR